MKKALFILIAITVGLGLKAQCPLATAVDFTATDCHGNEVHLFDILDGDQYVLIDFFFYNCSTCNTTIPMMVQAYQAFGCNMHDVYFMEISDRDSDVTCQDWVANHGVEYPTIGNDGGGNDITNQYRISSWPTVILIAPDHSIVIHELWPINNVQSIVTALENQGVQQYNCNTDSKESMINSLNVFPNPANDFVTLNGENLGTVIIYNALGQRIETFEANGNELRINTTRYENGVYFIKTSETSLRLVVTH